MQEVACPLSRNMLSCKVQYNRGWQSGEEPGQESRARRTLPPAFPRVLSVNNGVSVPPLLLPKQQEIRRSITSKRRLQRRGGRGRCSCECMCTCTHAGALTTPRPLVLYLTAPGHQLLAPGFSLSFPFRHCDKGQQAESTQSGSLSHCLDHRPLIGL